jgi:uncharacterized protein YuzE
MTVPNGKNLKPAFEVAISGRDDGTLEALYISVSSAKVSETREIKRNVVMADYDATGALIGIEILAPVKLSELARLVQEPVRKNFRKFVRSATPDELVTT